MKVKVDGSICSGHGRCYRLAPEVYSPDAEGYNAARDSVLEIAPGLEAQAQIGITNCPEAAITLVVEGEA
jgi:ferredoxin